jgi:hypothetical protein
VTPRASRQARGSGFLADGAIGFQARLLSRELLFSASWDIDAPLLTFFMHRNRYGFSQWISTGMAN